MKKNLLILSIFLLSACHSQQVGTQEPTWFQLNVINPLFGTLEPENGASLAPAEDERRVDGGGVEPSSADLGLDENEGEVFPPALVPVAPPALGGDFSGGRPKVSISSLFENYSNNGEISPGNFSSYNFNEEAPEVLPPAANIYHAAARPVSEYTLRLSLKNMCFDGSDYCHQHLPFSYWLKISRYADSISFSYANFPREEDVSSLQMINNFYPQLPLLAQGYVLPLIYGDQMLNDYDPRKRATTSIRTFAAPDQWALEVEEQLGRVGTAVTQDQLVRGAGRSGRDVPFNYPIRFYTFSEVFPGQKQFQFDRYCVKRDPTAPEAYATAGSLQLPQLDPNLSLSYYDTIPGGSTFREVQGNVMQFLGVGERGYYQNSNGVRVPFEAKWKSFQDGSAVSHPVRSPESIAIQDAACFQIDPSKPAAGTVIASALKGQIDFFKADGIITDN